MQLTMSRRELLSIDVWALVMAGASCWALGSSAQADAAPSNRFFFVSQGKTAMMNADGTGLRVFEFKEPNQATWQPCGCFADGNRVLFLSMEPRRDGPNRPFEEY